jgi:prevent-host-death family protein
MADSTWTVTEAKARFSELIERARTKPQTITRRGQPAAVVVSVEEWEKKSKRTGNLAEFFAASGIASRYQAPQGAAAEDRFVSFLLDTDSQAWSEMIFTVVPTGAPALSEAEGKRSGGTSLQQTAP